MNNKNYKPYVLNQDGSYTEISKVDELVIDHPATTALSNKEALCEYEEREI